MSGPDLEAGSSALRLPDVTGGESGGLDEAGVRHGSELASIGRDLLSSWERFLAPLRYEALDLLDIGVGNGASLRTWRAWFPHARLFGLEARRVRLDPPVPGSRVFHGSQADLDMLHCILREGRFRVVVDDGSRHAQDQIFTFTTLFPWLPPGSVYICAGIPTAFAGSNDNPAGLEAADWFASLGRSLLGGDAPAADPAVASLIRRKASGVFLMRGSAIVLSGNHDARP